MTKYLPANFLQGAAAALATWAVVNVMWLTTLAPSLV